MSEVPEGRPHPELGDLTIPRSVAIIMDGNGRWAQCRGRVRRAGHRAGAETVDAIASYAARIGVKHLTLYAFSTENWERPRLEVEMLWRLLVRFLRSRTEKCLREGIKLTAVGRRDRMPAHALRELRQVERVTSCGTNMTLCLALDYGGMWDLQTLSENVRRAEREGRLGDEPITEDDVLSMLGSAQVPPVDLLIRPGGESRTSNFLPVQLRYSEFLFLQRLWPDFTEHDFAEACRYYSSKHRRYGTIVESTPLASVGKGLEA